ncbi:neocarzinostatin apoprotein domain-containing protein [Streptomyces sp. BI20]|uniref:neocarzinostatin apoprotein domain-containing protein n=1 Tax=Streptomyces sp. BI20 TaxID=3403460 RepID=UPI003C73F62B
MSLLRPGPRTGRAAALFAGALAALSLWTGAAPASAATPTTDPGGPRLTVNRASGLADGDIVDFTIAGGPPKDYVWVVQCAPASVAGACDDATGRQFRVLPDGTWPSSPKKLYAVLETGAGPYDCRGRTGPAACRLLLTDNADAPLTGLPLRFRPNAPLEPAPTLKASPHRNLTDGQSVHATGRGYEVRYHPSVMLCATGSADTSGCRPRSRPPATTDAGRIDETLTVSATFTAIDGRAVDCRLPRACELVAFGSRAHGPATTRTPLHFTPTA